jgi:hypothetical protein
VESPLCKILIREEIMKKLLLIFLFTALIFGVVLGQQEDVTVIEPDSVGWRSFAPKLYIQCETWCDIDYIKSEIVFVNYVRERTEADIHLIITTEYTGSGGMEYSLLFNGQADFSDLNYSLICAFSEDATSDKIRRELVRVIKQGLIPFISRTQFKDDIKIKFDLETEPTDVEDKWDNWVFEVSLDGYASGERAHSYLWYNGLVESRRTTEEQKFLINGNINTVENSYRVNDSDIKTKSRNYYGSSFYAHSLGEHFSVGSWLAYANSKYSNLECRFFVQPTFEFNIFPYSEYAEHEFCLQYKISGIYVDYYEETIYEKEREKLLKETLKIGLSMTKCWGSIDISTTGSHYLHDFSKNSFTVDGEISLRLFAGLSFSVSSSYSIVHDQLALRKGNATEEEILLMLRELETDYTYWTSFGFSYTFGSIYSNVVNPRF